MTGQPLLTVRPGPVLYVWQGGQEMDCVPLDLHGALSLAVDLLAATNRAQAGPKGGPHGKPKDRKDNGGARRRGLLHGRKPMTPKRCKPQGNTGRAGAAGW